MITKDKFIQSLNPEQIEGIVAHLGAIYRETSWGQREKNLACLSWLPGEGHLAISDHWMGHETNESKCNAKNDEITFESDDLSGVNIEFTRIF